MILDPQRRSVYQVFVLVGTVRGYLINKYFIAALVRTELSCVQCNLAVDEGFPNISARQAALDAKKARSSVASRNVRAEVAKGIEAIRRLECKVCLNKEVALLFNPCGHLCTCLDCGTGLNVCPICRADVHSRARAFL